MVWLYLRDRSRASALRRWLLPPVLAAALLGVMGTSTPTYRRDLEIHAVESSASFPRDGIVAAIKEVALGRGLEPDKPNPPHWEGGFKGKGIFLTYSFREPNEVAVEIQIEPGMFGRKETRKAEAIREEIKKTLSLRFKDLRFVEPE
jgi:hypothetical protein